MFLKIQDWNTNHFFAVDNYERLSGAMEDSLKVLGEQARMYVEGLKADTVKTKEAVQSGNKKAIVQAVDKDAEDAKAGASHAKKNPKLYKLASEEAPAELEQTGKAIEAGKATGAAVTKLAGEFAKEISKDTGIPSDM